MSQSGPVLPPRDLPTPADVTAAAARLAGRVVRTPLLQSPTLDRLFGAEVVFKPENLQRTGAFKARGATNAVALLDDQAAQRGVVTHSSGNHGAALAMAAASRGIKCWVVVPENAAKVKIEAVRDQGAELVFVAPTQAAREAAAETIIERFGATFIHPSEDPRVIAGQGTAALELLADAGPLDLLLTPVGGGGLLSGSCLAVAAWSATATAAGRQIPRVVGVEPALADDAARSLASGVRQPQVLPARSLADGLLSSLGARTFALLTAAGVQIVTVEEAQIVAAMRLIFERLKIVVEPSAAVPVAALTAHLLEVAGARVGVILSGGNVDLDRLPW